VAIGGRVKTVDGDNVCVVDDDNQVECLTYFLLSWITFIFSVDCKYAK